MANILGIDLGTTYSAMARLDENGTPLIIENSDQMDEFLAQDRAMKAAREARMQSSGSTSTSGNSSQKTSQKKIDLAPLLRGVANMGFKESWAEKALQHTNNDVNAAIDWILMNQELLF